MSVMATTNPTTFNILFLLAEMLVLIKALKRMMVVTAYTKLMNTKVVRYMKSTVEQKVTHKYKFVHCFHLAVLNSQVYHMLYAILNLSTFVVTGSNLVNKFSKATKYEKSQHQFKTNGRYVENKRSRIILIFGESHSQPSNEYNFVPQINLN
mgnify:FL=1